MQRERVEDRYPWTWEVPLATACAAAVVMVVACQFARSLANFSAGAGWLWPTPDMVVTSVPGLIGGDATAGLLGVRHAADAPTLWAWLIVVGLLTSAGLTVAGVWVWRGWGPARMRGMATVAEAHELLGEDRLWKARHVVRPDLYPAGRRTTR